MKVYVLDRFLVHGCCKNKRLLGYKAHTYLAQAPAPYVGLPVGLVFPSLGCFRPESITSPLSSSLGTWAKLANPGNEAKSLSSHKAT